MKRLTIVLSLLAAAALSISLQSTASAQGAPAATVNIQSVVTGNQNTEHKVYTKQLTPGKYDVTVRAIGSSAVRTGNNILIRSGDAYVSIADVERQGFTQQTADKSLDVKNGTVTVIVKLGADKVFSSNRDIQFHKAAATKPVVAAAPAETRPAELPQTGYSTAVLVPIVLLAAVAYVIALFVIRSRTTQ